MQLVAQQRVSRMVLSRDGIAPMGGGSIAERTHRSLPAQTSTTPSLVVEAESDHQKIRDRYWKSQKSRKIPGGPHPVSETAKIRTEPAIANVAVWATRKYAGPRTKASMNQSVDPVDRRHDFASKSSAANVAYPSPCDGALPPPSSDAVSREHEKPLAEIAGIARTSRTAMKWASAQGRDLLRLLAQNCGNQLSPGGVSAAELRNIRKLDKGSEASCG